MLKQSENKNMTFSILCDFDNKAKMSKLFVHGGNETNIHNGDLSIMISIQYLYAQPLLPISF